MDINKLLDKAKEVRSLSTDGELAKALGVSKQAMSGWRNGARLPDAVACATLAGLTGEPLGKVLGIVGEARAISREEKAVWRKLATSALALFVMVGATTLPTHTANAAQRPGDAPYFAENAGECILCQSGRAFLTLIGDVLRWLRWRFTGRKPGPDNIEAFAA